MLKYYRMQFAVLYSEYLKRCAICYDQCPAGLSAICHLQCPHCGRGEAADLDC
jgi:hypothetical protein